MYRGFGMGVCANTGVRGGGGRGMDAISGAVSLPNDKQKHTHSCTISCCCCFFCCFWGGGLGILPSP